VLGCEDSVIPENDFTGENIIECGVIALPSLVAAILPRVCRGHTAFWYYE
jgi:hypothetical protein